MEKNSNGKIGTNESVEKLICYEEEMDAECFKEVEQIPEELQIIESSLTFPEFPCDPDNRIRFGFHRFKHEKFNKHREFYRRLAEGQNPQFMVFACSDSRVSPTYIFNFLPGEAFMFRNIANLVPPFDKVRYSGVGAALEYAVLHLHVPNILVVGHSRCGGIKQLMSDGPKNSEFIDDWMEIGQPAKEKVKREAGHLPEAEQLKLCEVEAVKLSLENLLSYPFVKDAVDEQKLALKGGRYDFVNGSLKLWDF